LSHAAECRLVLTYQKDKVISIEEKNNKPLKIGLQVYYYTVASQVLCIATIAQPNKDKNITNHQSTCFSPSVQMISFSILL